MTAASAAIAALLLAAAVVAGADPVRAEAEAGVVLKALDKVTTRSSTLEVAIDQTVRFRTLQITAHACDKRPPEERPEAAAFLDITEVREGRPPTSVFRGWMFASSPGLSPMQHPVYDVWVLDCVSTAASAPDSAAGSGSR